MLDITILYIDDDDIMTELMEIQLDAHGIQLSIAHTIEDGVATFDPQKHALTVIDWNLPEGDGTLVAKRIRSQYAGAQIVFLSTVFDGDRLNEANAFQPLACLKKDTDTADKIAELAKACINKKEISYG